MSIADKGRVFSRENQKCYTSLVLAYESGLFERRTRGMGKAKKLKKAEKTVEKTEVKKAKLEKDIAKLDKTGAKAQKKADKLSKKLAD